MRNKVGPWAVVVALAGCGGSDDAAKFVGTWAYSSTASASLTCGTTTMPVSLAGNTETFVESDGGLVKSDANGCTGLRFSVTGEVASLEGTGQSCMEGTASFAPSAYTFTLSSDGRSVTQAIGAATFTSPGMPACTATASNVLTKQ